MTNLAYAKQQEESNLRRIDFAAEARRRDAARQKKALVLQHRYGLAVLLLCAVCTTVALMTAGATDLTALLLLGPLGLWMLCSRTVLLYLPAVRTVGTRRCGR